MVKAETVVQRYLVAARFRPGDKVVINKHHGHRPWHGDKGTVEKYVPFNKYYVNMDAGDRRLVDLETIDPA